MKTKQSKKGYKAALRALSNQTLSIICLMEMGKAFDYQENGSITGYSLSEAVGAITAKIVGELREAGLLENYGNDRAPEFKAACEHATNVDYLLSSAALIVEELSNDSVIDEKLGVQTGTMLYTMAHEAGRNLDHAIAALNPNDKGQGFNDPEFRLDD